MIPQTTSNAAIAAEHLVRRFGNFTAVNDGVCVLSSRPSASHFFRPPSMMRTSS